MPGLYAALRDAAVRGVPCGVTWGGRTRHRRDVLRRADRRGKLHAALSADAAVLRDVGRRDTFLWQSHTAPARENRRAGLRRPHDIRGAAVPAAVRAVGIQPCARRIQPVYLLPVLRDR